MEHEQALKMKAPERYLLNEMSEPERFEFEAHFFECEDCAEDVRSGDLLVNSLRAIGGELPTTARARVVKDSKTADRPRFWDWLLRPSALIQSTGMAALALVAGYQALVVIPSLRTAGQTQVVDTAVLHAAARGGETVVSINGRSRVTILMLDVNAGDPGQSLQWNLEAPGGESVGSGTATVPPAGAQFPVMVSNSQLNRPGLWTLVLRSPGGVESGRYPFRIELK